MKSILCIACFNLCFLLTAYPQPIPLEPGRWDVQSAGHVFENYLDKPSLYLFQGRAELKDFDFFTGSIDYKIFGSGRRGFPGVQFRVTDNDNYEEFYLRLHQSGNPDANQYTPVFNGVSAWQLYYGEHYSAPVIYKENDWNHIRLLIAERQAEVYINDMDKPALVISELKHKPSSGKIRFKASGPSAFYITDFIIEKMSNVILKGKAKEKPALQEGTILMWQVTQSFSAKRIEGKLRLDSEAKAGLVWEPVAVEDKGFVNLSRRAIWGEEANTVFARVIIESDDDQVKKLLYGFSDHARVFLNNQLLAEGMDYNSSRDYRFLGTMGYYDAVYLNLKKGKNELWMAVTEGFGGWGTMAHFENRKGITIK